MIYLSELGKGATSETGEYLFLLIMFDGGVHSILLLPLVARCLETIDVCIWAHVCFYVCCSD